MQIINKLEDNCSLFETVIVSANDVLVYRFLKGEIRFTDISKTLVKILNFKEFIKLKKITPKKVEDISDLAKYVSLKINSMCI